MAPTFDLPPLDVRRVGEVAARLHVSRMTVRRLIASGRLPALRYSPRGVYLVPAAALITFGLGLELPSWLGLSSDLAAPIFLGALAIGFTIVFLVDPSWFHGTAQVRWPEPTFRNFVAVVLLALLASRPHAHAQRHCHKG